MANELINPQMIAAPMQGMSRLPWLRQLGVLVGLAVSVALGVGAVLWSQTPSYRPLYAGLGEKDQAQIVAELQKANIPFKLDPATGAVMVAEKQVHDARLKLAATGLPKGTTGGGFEAMEQGNQFGTSQFMEAARYQHALEGELSRSIMTISHVQSARVHLAVPRQSVFVRNRQQPSASVVVSLYPGRNLNEGQVSAIVHLVASSVPNLDPARVTIVDQMGRLLTGPDAQGQLEQASSQFDYARRLEDSLARRIESMLMPVIGPGGVRAQVAADLDFTAIEQAQETYKPDAAVRSEQVAEERTLPGAGVAGIPGSLSNQPPGPATVPEKAATAPATAAPAAPAEIPANTSKRATRNYELDKTISHTRIAPGRLKRLSVAVVVDNKQVLNEDGEVERQPLTKEELERLTALVKEAVGFSADRGDTVQVVNTPFTTPAPPEEPEEPALLDQPWVKEAGKQALGGLAVLFLVFGVLRPLMRSLATPAPALPAGTGGAQVQQIMLGGSNYETQLTTAKTIAQQDPKRVAQVVKNWVTNDA